MLTDRETVRSWVRALRPDRDEQVMVHRPWGSLAAVSDGKHPVGVILSDGEHTWVAEVPGAADQKDLTLEQVEHVVLDGMTSSARPQWPAWRLLVYRTLPPPDCPLGQSATPITTRPTGRPETR